MSNKEIFILILVLAASVQLTRWLPFLIFRNNDKLPGVINYLSNVLPAAVMGLLCVYCFKDYDYSKISGVIPAFLSAAVVILTHLLRRNTIISIALGTIVYMVLIRIM